MFHRKGRFEGMLLLVWWGRKTKGLYSSLSYSGVWALGVVKTRIYSANLLLMGTEQGDKTGTTHKQLIGVSERGGTHNSTIRALFSY